MPATTRRPYRSRTESIGVLREILSHGPLSTPQICEIAHAHRNSLIGWLREAERAGTVQRVSQPDQKPTIWALAAWVPVDPPPEGLRPFKNLVRKMTPGRWHTATELAAFRDQLAPALEAHLLEICRRWYEGHRGRKATLYKLTVDGEVAAGREPEAWGWQLAERAGP